MLSSRACRAGVLALAAAAALAGCAKLPRFTEQRAPSGRVYRVVGVGTVGFGSGQRALGIEYLPEKMGDAPRLALDAEELLALLSGQADQGRFDAVVVTAFKPALLPFPKRGSSATTIFSRGDDGVWRSRKAAPAEDPEARAADLRALDDAYARIERSVTAKDAADLESLQAPGFWHRLADGTIRPRAEENAELEKSLSSVSTLSARMTVSSVTLSGPLAVVVAEMRSTGALKSTGRRFDSTTISRDTWTKTPDGWRLALTTDLDDRFAPAKKR